MMRNIFLIMVVRSVKTKVLVVQRRTRFLKAEKIMAVKFESLLIRSWQYFLNLNFYLSWLH